MTYGELLGLTEGHGTSAIYEHLITLRHERQHLETTILQVQDQLKKLELRNERLAETNTRLNKENQRLAQQSNIRQLR